MLVVLSSYPKSGNTWLRRFICCYVTQRLVPLNELATIIPTDVAYRLWRPIMAMDHRASELDYLKAREEFYQKLSEMMADKIFFLKSHSAFGLANGFPIFDDSSIGKFIHIMRNPLDVLPSFAHHLGISVAEAWDKMKNPTMALAGGTEDANQFMELVLSWDLYTSTWIKYRNERPDKILILRYEDLIAFPITSFSKVVKHVGLNFDENILIKAINWSSFDAMKSEEAAREDGFREAAAPDRPFFRKGIVGSGKEEVPVAIRQEMYERWQVLLDELGYAESFQ